jgi:uncharacterized protein (DUF1697 family)
MIEVLAGYARERAEARQGSTLERSFGGVDACHRNVDDPLIPDACQPLIAVASAKIVAMRYVALLRGIGPMDPNMRNDKLRGVFDDLGFDNVETVISSGNVVFDSPSRAARAMESRIEAAWPVKLGFTSTTIIRTRRQIADLVARKPFGDQTDAPATSLQATFLKHEPKIDLTLPYRAEAGDYTIVAIEDRVICSVIDLTGSRTPDLMRLLEKRFGKEITTRSWKTVYRILRKLG